MQIRLSGFTIERLCEVGVRIRDLFADGTPNAERVRHVCDDAYVADLASAVTGDLGGKVGVAPRMFLRKLVNVLDLVDLEDDFDHRRDYALTIADADLSPVERNARAGTGGSGLLTDPDDIDLEL